MTDTPGTYEEWRVTGNPGDEYGPYAFTWRPHLGDDDPEASARRFIALIGQLETWVDGPHLHHRTVTITEWKEAE